jgi:hypothetical protein
MALINTASNVAMGDGSVRKVYKGEVQVWPPGGGTLTWRLSDFAGYAVINAQGEVAPAPPAVDRDTGFTGYWDGTEFVIDYKIPFPALFMGLGGDTWELDKSSTDLSAYPCPNQQERSGFTGLLYTADIDFSHSNLAHAVDAVATLTVTWYTDSSGADGEPSGGYFGTMYNPVNGGGDSDEPGYAMLPDQSTPAPFAIEPRPTGPTPDGRFMISILMNSSAGAYLPGATKGSIRIRDITWQRTDQFIEFEPNFPYTRMTVDVTPVAHDRIDVSWTDMVAAGASDAGSYSLTRYKYSGLLGLTQGPPGHLLINSSATSFHDTGLDPESRYQYKVEFISAHNAQTAFGSGTTLEAPPPPPPPTPEVPVAPQRVQKFVELEAVQSMAYNGTGGVRYAEAATCYYGNYGANNGMQKSLWRWDIPADVRNCISIDRVDVRVWNKWHFLNSGGIVGLTIHHNPTLGNTFGGSTEILQHGGANWYVGAPKPGWLTQDGSGWMTNIHVLTSPGRTTLAEEFRVNGAQGMGLAARSTSQSDYGYAAGADAPSGQKPAIRIWYTVNV